MPSTLQLLRTSGLLVLISLSQTSAHTWTDQLNIIAANGTFLDPPGYPRGFTPRGPGIDPHADMNVYELPPDGRPSGNQILPSDKMCKDSQTPGSNTAQYPRLKAYPGANVAIRYQENGHVTQPWLVPGKGVGSGVVYVYGTTESKAEDKYLDIHKVWTPTTSPGRLLATRYFDDGQCFIYDNNGSPISSERAAKAAKTSDPLMGPNLWCQTDVPLPTDIDGKTYTLYWVWDWPVVDESGNVKINQSYTSCIDLDIGPVPQDANSKDVQFSVSQNINFAAISTQMATPFNVDATAKQTMYSSGEQTPSFSSIAPAATGSAAPSGTYSAVLASTTSSAAKVSSAYPTNSNHTTPAISASPAGSSQTSPAVSASGVSSSDPLAFISAPTSSLSVRPMSHGGSNSTSSVGMSATMQASGLTTVTVTESTVVTVDMTSATGSTSANSTYSLRGRTFTR